MGKNILIVDDAKFMRNILKKILEGAGYNIIGEAETADEGIKLYSDKKPDFVTMDICMPNKSGIEAIKEIKKFDNNANILVCSALGQELLVMEAIQAGAKDFIVKPFKKDKILKTVKKLTSE